MLSRKVKSLPPFYVEFLESRRLLAATYVEDLQQINATNGWGPIEIDHSNGESGANDGHTLTLNGHTYAKGLGVHAASEVDFDFVAGSGFTNFQADVGVDDEVGNSGSVDFQVWIDNNKMFDSGTMTGATATKSVNVALAGVTGRLRLVVTDAGNGKDFDHADWADAKFVSPDAALPVVSLTGNGAAMSESGGSSTFQITRTGSTDDQLPVLISMTGAATRGSDYELHLPNGTLLTSNSVSIPAGAQSITLTAVGLQDTISDPAESVIMSLAPASGYTVGSPNSASSTITDDDQAPAGTTYVSDLAPTSSTNGWGPAEHDHSNGEQPAGDGKTLTLNGQTFAKGLGVHAGSTLVYNINEQYTTFSAVIGVDDEVGNNGSVIFQVFADGSTIFTSGVMTGAQAGVPISLDIRGKSELKLVVTDAGNGNAFDHADWADAKLFSETALPLPKLNITDATVTEGSVAHLVISLDRPATAPVTFSVSTHDGTAFAFEDYQPTGASNVTIPAGSSGPITVDVAISADGIAEPAEAFSVILSNVAGADVVKDAGTVTIAAQSGVALSSLNPVSAQNGWGPFEHNQSNGETAANDGRPITIQGLTYNTGLGVHANSDLTYNIAGQGFTTFYALFGIDDEVGDRGSANYQVYVDGVLVQSGGTTGSSGSQSIKLHIAGASTLRLVVTDAGDGNAFDHADWANAFLG